MTQYVVDASVVIKWFVPENHSEYADRLLNNSYDLLAPQLLIAGSDMEVVVRYNPCLVSILYNIC